MKITGITIAATILIGLNYCKAGFIQMVIPQVEWDGSPKFKAEIEKLINSGSWGDSQEYHFQKNPSTIEFAAGATVSPGPNPKHISITNKGNHNLEYLMRSQDRSKYLTFKLEPNHQDLIPGDAATVWVRFSEDG
ncbi:hypothetical protein PGT21_002359 [Puccinia graminis f. sp. tritici]|uniref:Uncharacterized protein n=1 Tax=Puccinia graminis f. sp. tritici TaxID=56615 RepID=A0A5B0NUV5_PUCGR|nr:hypothetical protein PGT21_002359 [Puccinia graminis f. sp. tritici]KAA1105118.1 hypothetical protein PGTUg99_013694 [Puccinia graminis f. sp. tritici]